MRTIAFVLLASAVGCAELRDDYGIQSCSSEEYDACSDLLATTFYERKRGSVFYYVDDGTFYHWSGRKVLEGKWSVDEGILVRDGGGMFMDSDNAIPIRSIFEADAYGGDPLELVSAAEMDRGRMPIEIEANLPFSAIIARLEAERRS